MNTYKFDEKEAYNIIATHWKNWAKKYNIKNFVIGISGGKDSTVVAALGCKIFGKKHIIGVSMPCDGQKDIEDVNKVFKHLGIKRIDIDIGDAFFAIRNSLENNSIDISEDTKINLPARLRMSTLYAVAQSLKNATVLNTCNLSEDTVGYATLYGDSAGSYAPISQLTVTEIRKFGEWLKIPTELVHKTPIDGLQAKTDEEKLGMTYAQIDDFIRNNGTSKELKKKIAAKYNANKFKTEIIQIPHPTFNYPNFIVERWTVREPSYKKD